MSESVWARLLWLENATNEAVKREAADRGEALELEISLRQKQTIRDALERERARRRIEELERALHLMLGHADDNCEECREARAVLKGERREPNFGGY